MSKILDRRTLLRGVLGGSTVSLGLPPLEAMLNTHGDAWAAGEAIPRRFGVWFWGCGVKLKYWVPAGTDTAWDPTTREELAPLANLKPYLSLVTGMEAKSTQNSAHHTGACLVTTGTYDVPNSTPTAGQYGNPAGPSVDQIAARAWDGKTRFSSLVVGVSRNGINGGYFGGGNTSFNSPTSRNPHECSPQLVFDRLFKGALPASSGASAAAQRAVRQSLLDGVRADAATLRLRLGARDRARIDQHLEGIRQLEIQLKSLGDATCAAPARPGAFPTDINHEELTKVHDAQTELMALALACDYTRAFSYEFSDMQSDPTLWEAGVPSGLHELTHNANMQDVVHKAVVFYMQKLASFLNRLKSVPIGAGNLLDYTCVLCTTEVAEGQTHSLRDIPMLLAGRAGGGLKGGIHYRSPNLESSNKVLLTALRSVGVPIAQLGNGPAATSDSIAALGT
jgi:hypothetical protein